MVSPRTKIKQRIMGYLILDRGKKKHTAGEGQFMESHLDCSEDSEFYSKEIGKPLEDGTYSK